MKRRTIITSVLVIVLCLGLISGSTFALFTSESSVNIAVTSGKVNVVATIDDTSLKVYSATADPTGLSQEELADVAGTLTGTFAGTYYYDKLDGTTFTNGGTVTLTDTKTLKIDKITPGDKVEVTVSVENNSNVKTKYRIKVNVLDGETLEDQAKSLKLFEGLTVNVGTDNAETRTATKLNGVIRVSDWYDLAARGDSDNLADVPVEIFLPLKAGNEYQDLKTEIQITVEAVQNNAATNTELETINAFLATQTPTTMYAAVKSLADNSVLGLTSYAAAFAKVESYLWNVDTNQFYAESDATDFAYKYFKVYDAMPTTVQTYSIYAGSAWQATSVTGLTVGFDAGETTGITSVTYNRSTAEYGQDVVIRTNSAGTTLTINAPKDTVKHYDNVGTLNIIAAANASYHEYGTVAFAEISKGRIAIEKGSNITNLHISSIKENDVTTNKFDSIIISIDENATKPTLSRDDVEIASTGTLVVAIQEGTKEVTEKTELDYVWLTKQGIFEQIKVSDNSESMEDAKWADDDEFEATNTQEAAVDIANNIGRDNDGNIKVEVKITKQDVNQQEETKIYKVVLDENRDLVVVDKADTTEKPLATLDDKTSTVQVGTTEFTVALTSSQDNKEAELTVTNTADTTEVHKADAVSNSGLNDEQKIEIAKSSRFKKYIDDGYSFVVGDTGYTSLKAAFDNVQDNQTIYLIKNLDFAIQPTEVTNENLWYWFGSGFSKGTIKSYIHLDNKQGIVFDMNGFVMNVDYSFNFIDYFYPSGYTSNKAFIYLSGEGSLKIMNGTMNIKFDYKNRATTETGSSVYNSGYTYAAIYVHNNPSDPGTKTNADAIYDIPYQTELSMIDCSLKTNQIPLYLHHGARVTELNADIMYYCESAEISNVGKGNNIYYYNIQNNNYHCIYMNGGSKIDKITGGSYISCDQRELDEPNFPIQAQGSALYVNSGYRSSATYYPNVYVPRAEVGEISGGIFKSNGSYPVEIKGYVNKISGGIFGRIEGTYAGRNTMYFNPTICLSHPEDNAGIGSITGGTFIGGSNPNRPDGLYNIIAVRPKGGSGSFTYPSLAEFIEDGYVTSADVESSYNVTTARTTEPIIISCYAYKVETSN